MKKILVHSGGGCKGYLSAQLIKKLEEENGPLNEYYDLMAGSSVGAINTAILATGKISAKDLVDMYPSMIKRIFKHRFLRIPFYDRNNFVKVWKEIIGVDFKMKDCKCKLQITSVDLTTQRNHFFKSWEEEDGEERLVDVVLRSFAAPLYFGKMIDEKNKAVWFDGGMGSSNIPIDQARIEARDVLEWKDTLSFDAVGCGYHNQSISFEKAKRYRTLKQLFSFVDVSEGGLARAQSTEEQVSRMKIIALHQKNIGFRYWDIEIPKAIDKLDGVKFLGDYKIYGLKMASRPPIVEILPDDYCS